MVNFPLSPPIDDHRVPEVAQVLRTWTSLGAESGKALLTID